MSRQKPTTYELANEVIRRAGIEDPEKLSDAERMDIVMRHVFAVGSPPTDSYGRPRWKDPHKNGKTGT